MKTISKHGDLHHFSEMSSETEVRIVIALHHVELRDVDMDDEKSPTEDKTITETEPFSTGWFDSWNGACVHCEIE